MDDTYFNLSSTYESSDFVTLDVEMRYICRSWVLLYCEAYFLYKLPCYYYNVMIHGQLGILCTYVPFLPGYMYVINLLSASTDILNQVVP